MGTQPTVLTFDEPDDLAPAQADELELHTLAPPIAATALILGCVGDVLMHDGPEGIGFPLWIALSAFSLLALTWRAGASMPKESAIWLSVSIFFATGLAWRDSEPLVFFDLLACLGAIGLAIAPMRTGRSATFVSRLRDAVWAAVVLMGDIAKGFAALVRPLLAGIDHERWSSSTRYTARVVGIASILILVFGSLLRSADPVFASLLRLPAFNGAELFSHVILIGFLSWVAAGVARASLPTTKPIVAPEGLPFYLGPTEITTAFTTLIGLFALFVFAQLGVLFGGEAFLRARTGLTVAQYARQGFFQMLWVVILVMPLLFATRVMLQPGRALARRHTMLAVPVILLLGAIIVSAILRLRLYIAYYGFTADRFYPLVFMLWLGVVLALFAVTVLRDRLRPFIGGTIVSALATLATLNVIAPDRIVARVNIDRASAADRPASARPLDIAHLATLSGGAADLVVPAVLSASDSRQGTRVLETSATDRCRAATRLLDRFGPTSAAVRRRDAHGSWRYWNAGRAAGVDVIARHGAALRTIQHEACAIMRAERAAQR
jgi:hypothetical protein